VPSALPVIEAIGGKMSSTSTRLLPSSAAYRTLDHGKKISTATSISILNCRIKNIEPRNWWPKGCMVRAYEVREGIGGTGVVGVMRNGRGPTVLIAR